MYLKCRHLGVYFLYVILILPSRLCSIYNAAQKMRADNIEDYGERLSSIERGRMILSGKNEPRTKEDSQEEGMSVEEAKDKKLQEEESLSIRLLSKEEDDVSQTEKLKGQEKSDENSKDLELGGTTREEKFEEKNASPEENTKEHDEKDVSLSDKEQDMEKLDLTKERSHEENANKSISDVESSTKCTTDREITIGDYKPPEDSKQKDNGDDSDDHGDGKGEGDEPSKILEGEKSNEISDEPEKTVSKVYKGPKPAKAPDHYIDDV